MDELERMVRLAEHGMLETETVGETSTGMTIKVTPSVVEVLDDRPDLLNEITKALEAERRDSNGRSKGE